MNALREEGTRDDLMEALERAWTKVEWLENEFRAIADKMHRRGIGIDLNKVNEFRAVKGSTEHPDG